MARRPLIATIVTTLTGALMGMVLGAIVGRVISLFLDPTIEDRGPIIMCAVVGFFVASISAAKGSLDRFGAARTGVGTTLAAVVLIAIVAGAGLSGLSLVLLLAVAVAAAAIAGAVAALVGAPQAEPVVRRGSARPAAPKAPPPPELVLEKAEKRRDPEPVADVVAPRPAIRKVPVAPPEPEPEPDEYAAAGVDAVNWALDEKPAPPRRREPLRREPLRATRADEPVEKRPAAKNAAPKKAAPTKAPTKPTPKKAPPKITPPPAARGRRERPLRKDDA